MSKEQRIAVVIVAAGRGKRVGGETPKQWRSVNGRSVADWAIAAFRDHPRIDQIAVVLHPDDNPVLPDDVLRVEGGPTRSDSVLAGLEALADAEPTHVLIHDGARPAPSAALISRVLAALEGHDAAAPALQVTDALWRVEGERVVGIGDRNGLARAQTPQGFAYREILHAHRERSGEPADDVEVALAAGLDVRVVPGDEDNLKVTYPGDFARAERILGGAMDVRTGNGFDVHRFGDGDRVMLCGIAVPHDRGLQGHSDADVGMHALTDAIYGALAEGDIGRHFPPSDSQWKGTASAVFLRHAAALADERGFAITHADVTLVCERPKIGPHAEAMRDELSRITGIAGERISVKATTSERLGFTGRGEGIAAIATATLVRR